MRDADDVYADPEQLHEQPGDLGGGTQLPAQLLSMLPRRVATEYVHPHDGKAIS